MMFARFRMLVSRLFSWKVRAASEARLREEIQTHLELLADENVRQGMTRAEAMLAARREFGGAAQMQEEFRDQRGLPWVESTWKDVQLALRSLGANRAMAALAVLSLALGTGANTAIFSVLESVLLRPLPFSKPDQLMLVFDTAKSGAGPTSLPNLRDWREQNRSFSELSAFSAQTMALTGNGRAERVRGGFVSSHFFQVLGIAPELGVAKSPRGERTAILSYGLWQRRFESDRAAIGKNVVLNAEPYRVIGVLPAGFRFPLDEVDVWVPDERYATSMNLDRAMRGFLVFGRLRDGVAPGQAAEDMAAVAANLAKQYPKENAGRTVTLMSFHDFLSRGLSRTLLVIMGAASLLLLISCANVAGLLAARAATQRHQLAIRIALGASRGRIARQLLAEGMTLACIGGAFGLLLSRFLIQFLPSMLPGNTVFNGEPQLNQSVLLFSIAISFVVGLLASLIPALTGSHVLPHSVLQQTGRGGGGPHSAKARDALVVFEIAASLVLVVSGGLLLNSLIRLMNAPLGISPDHVLTMEYRVNRAKHQSRAQQWSFHRSVVEAAQAIPGVHVAALARAVPFSGNGGTIGFTVPAGAGIEPGERPVAVLNTITDGYFDAMGIPLLRGRSCGAQDVDGGPVAIMVNDKLASRFWPSGDSFGQSLHLTDFATGTIVGVVGGNRQNDLRRDAPWQVYVCYAQNPGTLAALVMRTASDPLQLAEAARKVIWAIDSDQAVWKVRTMESMVESETAGARTISWLVIAFATVAVLLAVAGVYGLVSYAVTQRTREIGIRMALGARSASVLGLVMRRVCVLTGIGLILGLAGTWAAGRALSVMLYEVEPTDTLTLGLCSVLLAVVAVVAGMIPARKALDTDPAGALRT